MSRTGGRPPSISGPEAKTARFWLTEGITKSEIGRRLGVSEASVRRWVDAGCPGGEEEKFEEAAKRMVAYVEATDEASIIVEPKKIYSAREEFEFVSRLARRLYDHAAKCSDDPKLKGWLLDSAAKNAARAGQGFLALESREGIVEHSSDADIAEIDEISGKGLTRANPS